MLKWIANLFKGSEKKYPYTIPGTDVTRMSPNHVLVGKSKPIIQTIDVGTLRSPLEILEDPPKFRPPPFDWKDTTCVICGLFNSQEPSVVMRDNGSAYCNDCWAENTYTFPDYSVIPQSTFDYFNKPESERISKGNNMNTEQLQTQLMQAVSYHFDKDAIRPGVVTSSLRDGKIYASIVRYGKQFTNGKQVVCKKQGTSLKEVLTSLSCEFLDKVHFPVTPLDALKQLVSDKPKKI